MKTPGMFNQCIFVYFILYFKVIAFINTYNKSVVFCGSSEEDVTLEAGMFVKHLNVVKDKYHFAANVTWNDKRKLRFLSYYLRKVFDVCF